MKNSFKMVINKSNLKCKTNKQAKMAAFDFYSKYACSFSSLVLDQRQNTGLGTSYIYSVCIYV